MAAFVTSKTLRVLAISELLDIIFRFLDDASNTSNARVCKQWSELALDALWKDVRDLRRLFSLLAPLEAITVDEAYGFTRPLETSDWRRFERYCRRIRTLSYLSSEAGYTLHESVFDDIARSRMSLDILPCLHALEWDAPLSQCVLFMHKNVKSFAVTLPREIAGAHSFFEDVAARMPHIIHLDLRFRFSIASIENSTIDLLQNLTRLQKLTLPRFCFTTKIAQAVSHLEDLEAIEFQYFERQGCGHSEDVIQFKPSLVEGSFPSLWDLNITVLFDDATNFLDTSFAPTNLTSLFLESLIIETPTNVLRLVTAIAENCQLLKMLVLVSHGSSIVSTQVPNKDDCLTMDTLRPLFKCPNLISLDVMHHHPLHLQQEDVEEIATSWPGLEKLFLNNEPIYLEQSNLTLRALLPFARYCPKLHTLGLFINATTADIPSPSDTTSPYQHMPFKALRCLSMGVSIIQEEGPVALFLSQICPLDCTVVTGITWHIPFDFAIEISEIIRLRCEKWDKVKEFLPLLTRLRMQERERARLLQEEVEDLRIRTAVLKDKAFVGSTSDGCVAS
ncbi:hypothetical protein FPV67DRAFT_1669950 [Lyophyllum atratum]|nr:hypothetical protein FPV67DRAFT_1669950 [Lyophyllum atratum]